MPGLDLKAVLGSKSVEGLSLESSGEAASAPGLDLKGARQTAPCALQRWSRSKWEQFVPTRPNVKAICFDVVLQGAVFTAAALLRVGLPPVRSGGAVAASQHDLHLCR